MENIARISPVSFDAVPLKTEDRNNWSVVLEYEDQGTGPYLVDLSHRTRWDMQDAEIGEIRAAGIPVPEIPGQCIFNNGLLVNRMNRTQASIWHLSGEPPAYPDNPAFTDTTDSTVFLAVFGNDLFAILEKLTALDFLDPNRQTPFLLQGPFSHVPCQIVSLQTTPEKPGTLLTCSRGYARDMVAAILEAGIEFNIRPAGEQVFSDWLDGIS